MEKLNLEKHTKMVKENNLQIHYNNKPTPPKSNDHGGVSWNSD